MHHPDPRILSEYNKYHMSMGVDIAVGLLRENCATSLYWHPNAITTRFHGAALIFTMIQLAH